MRNRNKIIIVAILIITVILVGFVVWAETPPHPMQEAFDAMQSDTNVNVTDSQWLVFEPATPNNNIGFISTQGAELTTGHMLLWPTQ